MGYRRVRLWISDYHFDRATTHRLNGDGGVDPDGGSERPRGECSWYEVWSGTVS